MTEDDDATAIELPEIFPIFPLNGALLLPRGRLPLNIFEPRYLAMVDDALGAGRMLGMIQSDTRKPATGNGPGLFRVGCLGRLSAFSETDDGRYLITLTGVVRFTVIDELPVKRGYRRIRAEFSSFADDLLPLENSESGIDRDAIIAALHPYFAAVDIDANWEAIHTMPDDDLLITLSMACPFSPPEKQALLEADGTIARAEVLLALLEINAHLPRI